MANVHCFFVFFFFNKVTQEILAVIKAKIRQQSQCHMCTLVRKPRLIASPFHEIFYVCGESSGKALASCIMKGKSS